MTETATSGATRAQTKQVGRLRVPFEFKVEGVNEQERTFSGLASTWGLDLGNDRIHPGAFARTLSHWKNSGRVIPLIDVHGDETVKRVIGKLTEGEETPEGLRCAFGMLEEGDPDADAAWKRIKGRYVEGLSIGYRAIKYDYEQPEGTTSYWDQIRNLYEIELRHVGVVIWGMNAEALLDAESIKSLTAALREGRLTDEQKIELRALLDGRPPAPAPAPPAADTPKGLAPEDPRRLAMAAALRDLTIRGLAAA